MRVALLSANNDETVFAEPRRFDLARGDLRLGRERRAGGRDGAARLVTRPDKYKRVLELVPNGAKQLEDDVRVRRHPGGGAGRRPPGAGGLTRRSVVVDS